MQIAKIAKKKDAPRKEASERGSERGSEMTEMPHSSLISILLLHALFPPSSPVCSQTVVFLLDWIGSGSLLLLFLFYIMKVFKLFLFSLFLAPPTNLLPSRSQCVYIHLSHTLSPLSSVICHLSSHIISISVCVYPSLSHPLLSPHLICHLSSHLSMTPLVVSFGCANILISIALSLSSGRRRDRQTRTRWQHKNNNKRQDIYMKMLQQGG